MHLKVKKKKEEKTLTLLIIQRFTNIIKLEVNKERCHVQKNVIIPCSEEITNTKHYS